MPQFNVVLPEEIKDDLRYLVRTHPGMNQSDIVRMIIHWYAKRYRDTVNGAELFLDRNGRYEKLEL